MVVVSHPTVNVFNRALVEALDREGLLEVFHTTLAVGRRSVQVDSARVRQHWCRETARLIMQRVGLRSWVRAEGCPFSVDAIYRSLDRVVSQNLAGAPAVYAYEDGALETFRTAKELGMTRFYELPIAYFETVQRLLREEAERLPAWAATLGAPDDSADKLDRKAEELRLADFVICPSTFVQQSLPAGIKSVVAEFGSPNLGPVEKRMGRRSLRVLFAGSMTQRKGLADVFAAMRLLGRADVELVVMGSPVVSLDFYRREWPHFRHEPPRPHSAVLDLMNECDVLVLPSIVEGRALVQQEALSRGLPLLVTANAGGEDLVEEGVTGWLVPIRSPERIAERIDWLVDHRDSLPDMQRAARRMAADRSWDAYTAKILGVIQQTERNR